MPYSQFIHGKLNGDRHYQLIALTADLQGREAELQTLAQTYRFWGQQPPSDSPIALGVFHDTWQGCETILIAQAMQALQATGQPALDIQGRPYIQHRYVFMPKTDLHPLLGRLWLLLNWIMTETKGIPIFQQLETNLEPLTQPDFGDDWFRPRDEQRKLQQALTLSHQPEQPVLLSALAALINQKRIIFDAADTHDIYSEDLLESLLLLLPACLRSQASIAAGAIEANHCTQAQIMVKTDGLPSGALASDLVWVKRANNQFFGSVQPEVLGSAYTSLLKPILAQETSLGILLRLLDSLDGHSGNSQAWDWNTLTNGTITPHLIPALPDSKARQTYWQTALKNLSPEGWQKTLPFILDDVGLEIAWLRLQTEIKRQPTSFAPLAFNLWKNFSQAYITYTLQEELPADLVLAENLIRHGLLTALGEEHRGEIYHLCLHLVRSLTVNKVGDALSLSQFILSADFIGSQFERLLLQEAVLPLQASKSIFITFFNDHIALHLSDLSLSQLAQSRVYQALIEDDSCIQDCVKTIICSSEWLNCLPELATRTDMTLTQRGQFYVASLVAWQPSYHDAKPLLRDLTVNWVATYAPDQRPSLSSIFAPLHDWLARYAPPPLIRYLVSDDWSVDDTSDQTRETDLSPPLKQSSTEAKADATSTLPLYPTTQESVPMKSLNPAHQRFEDWCNISQALFDDQLGQISFLDHATVGQPLYLMVRQWLLGCVEHPSAKARFEVSYTWHTLQTEGPAWLADGIAQILGWQEISLSALLPIIERVQQTLNLPQTTLFKFLESRPRHSDDDLGLLLSAYLSHFAADSSLTLEDIPLWPLLQSQAPKVAQLYKTLAEGQGNHSALDLALDKVHQLKLSAALTESPTYAGSMTHWLYTTGKGAWISGRLLETLIEHWVTNIEQVDQGLLATLLQADLTESYTATDWMALARLCWHPDYQSFWPSNGHASLSRPPSLNPRQQAQIVTLAQTHLKAYTSSAQTEKLLVATQQWGLSHAHLAEIMSQASPATCNFDLLQPYLYVNDTILQPTDYIAQALIRLALTITVTNEDSPNEASQGYQTFLICLLKQQLQDQEAPFQQTSSLLSEWYQVTADTSRYLQALRQASQHLASDYFSLLVKKAYQLKQQREDKLSQMVTMALDDYWQGEKKRLGHEGG